MDPIDPFNLTDRVAMVTGGAGGLGRAIGRGLAASGAKVAFADIEIGSAEAVAAEVNAQGRTALAVSLDVTDARSIQEATDLLCKEFGRIDILVNSHGVTKRMPSEELPEAEWDRVIAVNLKGLFLCCQIVGRRMLQQRSGSIINLASIGGLVALPLSAAYCASKGGVVQLTRTLGVEWAPRGVRVNAIAPCSVNTPLVQKVLSAEPEYRSRVIDKIPAGRIAEPSDMVGAALFLASDASAMVIGTVLSVDGGYVAQ